MGYRKLRPTNVKNNPRVQLAKSRPVKEEGELITRETMIKRTSVKFLGNQEKRENLTASENRGLRKLKKRVKEVEIVMVKSDKSGKLCVVDIETYRKM